MKTPLSLLVICLISFAPFAFAQNPSQQSDEVVRITTDLVQTDVIVFDKQGRFVDGLKKEDFEVRADGKPVEVNFFDRIIAGSPGEEAQVGAGRGTPTSNVTPAFRPTPRGRTIIIFIDDLHLSALSVEKTRRAILEFIENEMGANDQVAIASATGQIGFLQQFTDNKAVLRAAIKRLNHRPYVIQDIEQIKMTEYQAIRISQGDKDSLDYFTTELLKSTNFVSRGGKAGPPSGGPVLSGQSSNPAGGTSGLSRQQAEGLVKSRAEMMIKQSVNITRNTLATLESLMRVSAQLRGRKLVFLISDGFYLIDRNSGANDAVRQITDAAVRAGVVIYSLDARGMTSMTDVTSNRADASGRLARADIGELSASQDGLNALAEDTGGRALFNSDSFKDAMTRALRETSNYYLLAWRPTSEDQKGGKFKRIEVAVKGRPDLTVRLPRGYLEPEVKTAMGSATTPRNEKKASSIPTKQETLKPVEADLRDALTTFAPKRGIPTIVSTSYLDTPNNGTMLTASMQLAAETFSYGPDGKQAAAVDIAGVVLNDQGKNEASFKTRLNVSPLSSDPSGRGASSVIYNYKSPLKPGIYQVRVAARDDKTGRVGSAQQWIEIPDLSTKHLALSSLLIGGQVIGSAEKRAEEQIQFSVDRHFSHASHLSFWVFIYNAQRNGGGTGTPDVTAQVQVFRDGQVVVNMPQRKLSTAGMADLARIPYGGDFALASLPSGRYLLQVTITDHVANTSATQRASFDVE
jgi:VWFA-related protein